MSSIDLSKFEKRADEAENLIKRITARLAAIEKNATGEASPGMNELQKQLEKEKDFSKKMLEENEELKKANSKLQYRVEHLLKILEEEERKAQKSPFWYVECGKPETFEYRGFFLHKGVPVSAFHDIPLWYDRETGIANMVLEIPKGGRAKLEINKEEPLNPIKQDIKKGKLRYVALDYPFNYGAFPQTWENPDIVHPGTNAKGDNDPLDVVDISSLQGKTGQVKAVKILGTYAMIDEGETDWKIVCIDINDPLASKIHDAEDIEKHLPGKLKQVFEFLRDYKIPDGKPANQFAYNNELKDKKFAIDIVEETHQHWEHFMQKGYKTISRKNTTHSIERISFSEAVAVVEKHREEEK